MHLNLGWYVDWMDSTARQRSWHTFVTMRDVFFFFGKERGMISDLLQQGSIWSVRLLLQCCSTRLHWMLKGWCRNGETVMSLSHHRPPLCLMLCRVAMLTCSPGCFAPANKVCYPLSFCLCSNRIQAYMPHWTWFGTFLVNVAYLHKGLCYSAWDVFNGTWWVMIGKMQLNHELPSPF